MVRNGITPKFTLNEIRDNISLYKCGTRAQSRRFYKLDENMEWTGDIVALKSPVIHVSVFPEDVRWTLIKC